MKNMMMAFAAVCLMAQAPLFANETTTTTKKETTTKTEDHHKKGKKTDEMCDKCHHAKKDCKCEGEKKEEKKG